MADTLSASSSGSHSSDPPSITSPDDIATPSDGPRADRTDTPSPEPEAATETGRRDTPSPDGGIWSSTSGPSTTEAQASRSSPSQPHATAIPTDPYARPVHAISGYLYATWWRRAAAFLLDGAVLSLAGVFFWFVFGTSFSSGRIAYVLSDVAGGAYLTILVAGLRGQTPGMRATGIAVRDKTTGGAVGYPKALLRAFLMFAFAAPGMVFFVIDCLVPLWQKDRQAIHDMAAGTVVVEVRNGVVVAPGPAGEPDQAPATKSQGSSQLGALLSFRRGIQTIFRFVGTRGSRFWITGGSVAVACVLVFVTIRIATAMVSAAHSPTNAAIDYLKALSAKDVSAMAKSSGIVAADSAGSSVTVLLSPRDIATELAQPGNAIGDVSDINVTSSKVSGDTAEVTLQYIAGNQVHSVRDALIKSSANSSGWAVQVTPARLDIDVPAGVASVQIDGMSVRVDGQMAHVVLYPSVAEVSAPATSIWQATGKSVDATHQTPGSPPQEVTMLSTLAPAASSSAKAVVAKQVTACVASASLAPANCPNSETPPMAYQGDTDTGIVWSAKADPAAGLIVNPNPNGTVSVAGSLTATVSYTDTTHGDFLIGPIANAVTDGPTTWNFSYPLTWNGSGWDFGKVQIQSSSGGSA